MYRKNVAGQNLGFALVNASTGAALTGATVTVKRMVDGAAQASATGTVSEGGSGQYNFALSQADTNGNQISLLFTATGAIPVEKTIVTTAADPTDAVRFGLTALPNAAAEAAGGLYTRGSGAGQINQPANGQIDANTVKVSGTAQTARDLGASVLLSAGTGTGQLDFTSGVVKANLAQILGTALTETAGQIAGAFKKLFDVAAPVLTATSVNQTGDSFARLGAPAGASVSADVAAVNAKTTNLPASPAATGAQMDLVNAPNATALNAAADALLDRAAGIESGWTLRQGCRMFLASLAGLLSGATTTTVTITNPANTKNRIIATVDANGNRSAITYDAS